MSTEAIDQSVFDEEVVEAIYVPVKPGSPHWTEGANCTKANPYDLDQGRSHGKELTPNESETIARFCLRCNVRQECLDDALATKNQFGIRGGTTQLTQRRLAKEIKRNGVLTEKDFKGLLIPFVPNATREIQAAEEA